MSLPLDGCASVDGVNVTLPNEPEPDTPRIDALQRDAVTQALQEIIRNQFSDPSIRITDAAVVDDIPDWGSIAHVQIVVAIEGRFGILFEPEEFTEFSNFGEMIDRVCSKLGAARTGTNTHL